MSAEVIELGAARYATSDDGREIQSRDVLLEALRRIDAGDVAPTALTVVYCEGDAVTTMSASPLAIITLGMLTQAKAAVAGDIE